MAQLKALDLAHGRAAHLRLAVVDDVTAIVGLLADDRLGQARDGIDGGASGTPGRRCRCDSEGPLG
ncbi:hypothetical protein IWX64_002013 [Arthrobacter sp. CAN_A212]|uniref:hypothetical protein n=1 Tax=Arthrobacter sp. CAN_A212 TaxID=2787719 RepID=UPI0018C9A69D